jgi:hypothetical protein
MQPLPTAPVLPDLPAPRTYQVRTDTTTTVRERTVRNTIVTTFRLTPTGFTEAGNRLVRVEQLDFHQQADDPLAQLLNDLNGLNERLLWETGPYNTLLALRNPDELDTRWHQLQPVLLAKYGQSEAMLSFMSGVGRQLRSESLLPQLAHKGGYGLLFSGLFGPDGAIRTGESTRLISGFFNTIDLPLRLQTSPMPHPDRTGHTLLRVEGKADPDRMDEAGLRAMAREAADLPNFRVAYRVDAQEEYVLDGDYQLVAAWQELTAVIENLYYAHTRHDLKLC